MIVPQSDPLKVDHALAVELMGFKTITKEVAERLTGIDFFKTFTTAKLKLWATGKLDVRTGELWADHLQPNWSQDNDGDSISVSETIVRHVDLVRWWWWGGGG